MAVHKAVKTGSDNPFLKTEERIADVIRVPDGDYYITTEAARAYETVLHYFRWKEPNHPLLESLNDGDRIYWTVDLKENYNRMLFYELSEYNRGAGRVKKLDERVLNICDKYRVDRTPLLDILVDQYGVGRYFSAYSLTSRRRREYQSVRISPELLPFFSSLGIYTKVYNRQGGNQSIFAHSVRYRGEALTLRHFSDYLFSQGFLIERQYQSRIDKTFFSSWETTDPKEKERYYQNGMEGIERRIPIRGSSSNQISLDGYLELWERKWEETVRSQRENPVDPEILSVYSNKVSNWDWLQYEKTKEEAAFLIGNPRSGYPDGGNVWAYYHWLEDACFLHSIMEYIGGKSGRETFENPYAIYLQEKERVPVWPDLPFFELAQYEQLSLV